MLAEIWNNFYAIVGVALLVLCYYIFFIPLHLKDTDSSDKVSAVKRAQKMRKIGTKIPPPFPNGWYRLAASREIKAGTARHVDCIGEHFVVFRSQDSNKVFVLDAYCPHMGASLGVGGIVKGDCIECPFHQWKYSGENGALINIPYSENLSDGKNYTFLKEHAKSTLYGTATPLFVRIECTHFEKFAKIRKWSSKEVNGFIFVWYHRENEEPWEIPVIEEVESGKFTFQGSNEFRVHCHIQDIPENGADVAHLATVHGSSILAGSDLNKTQNSWLSIGTHIWNAKWSANESHRHLATVKLSHEINFLSFKFMEIDADIVQAGPGLTLTPLEPLVQKLSHDFYAPWYLGWFTKFVTIAETINVARDVMIWNSKEFVRNPPLPKEEKPLKLFRNWFSQFYSENSKSFAQAHETLDW